MFFLFRVKVKDLNMALSKDDLAVGLKVFTTVATGCYTGGAWFLLFGAVPTARSLKPSCCLKVTKSVFERCAPMGVLSLGAMLGGAGVYLLSRGGNQEDASNCGWILTGCVFGAMHPYTLKFLMPINNRVLNKELPEDEAHSTMDRWWNFHLWRTIAASGCFVCLTYLIAKQ